MKLKTQTEKQNLTSMVIKNFFAVCTSLIKSKNDFDLDDWQRLEHKNSPQFEKWPAPFYGRWM